MRSAAVLTESVLKAQTLMKPEEMERQITHLKDDCNLTVGGSHREPAERCRMTNLISVAGRDYHQLADGALVLLRAIAELEAVRGELYYLLPAASSGNQLARQLVRQLRLASGELITQGEHLRDRIDGLRGRKHSANPPRLSYTRRGLLTR